MFYKNVTAIVMETPTTTIISLNCDVQVSVSYAQVYQKYNLYGTLVVVNGVFG